MNFFATADVSLPQPESHYGLSLPLGGAEVTMEDLVRLYATLANGGRLQPLRRFLHEPPGTSQRVLSPEAAFLTLEMLGQIPRPGMTFTDSSRQAQVFWKTGTSHGFRDAWSVAVFDRYVLAVWVGNFDGRRNPAFIGRTGAAPLLFQMIDGLRAEPALAARAASASARIESEARRILFGFRPAARPILFAPHGELVHSRDISDRDLRCPSRSPGGCGDRFAGGPGRWHASAEARGL